jgi:hypothetical protein
MKYLFDAEVWRWRARSDLWMFVSLPEDASDEIRGLVGDLARGFGSVPVDVRVGGSRWTTSIFPGGGGLYSLPVKAAVRRAEGFDLGETITVEVEVRL